MNKVGILSMQRIKNYGSFLQAYGLKKIIEELGYKVEFVDYHVGEPLIGINNSKKKFISKFKKVVDVFNYDSKFFNKINYIKFKTEYDKKYLQMLGITDKKNYNPCLDTLVIGSDEVFNCIQSNPNVGYSLELFGKDNHAKQVITYAASFGNTTMEKLEKNNKIDEISDYVNNISKISVRDKNSAEIMKSLTNKEVCFNLDPVLMYDYMNKCDKIPEISTSEKYMIVYAYNGRITKKESNYLKKYAKSKNLKIYSMGGTQGCTDKFIDCSPFEVLAYFKNAECIVTDTFHGSIFSIITHKPFVTLVRKSIANEYGNEEKLTDLLERLKLVDRLTYDIESVGKILTNKIDFSKVEKILNSERIKTRDYLKSSLDLSSSVKHINICDSNCCGCGACLNICPKGAISMKKNKAGFIYPCIDKDKCINCGLCERVCNYRKQSENDNNHMVKSYASCTLNKDIIINSASGGIFAQIASNILKNDGIVYGAALEKINGIWFCHHKRVNDLKGLTQLQGSKYVQSNIENTYSLAKKDLNDGKTVLFSGTPCQISGLYGYLNGKKYDNLYTIDIICHGVPSNDLFNEYLSFLENKYKKKIVDFKFRDKSKKWGLYFKILFDDGSFEVMPAYQSSYYQLFLDSDTYRENCYSCPYSNLKRPGNISIGDYWGISEEYPEYVKDKKIDEKYGISCLIVNNTHGNELIEKFSDNLSMLDSDVQKIVKHNHQLSHPSISKGNRKKVYNLLENHCYNELSSYYKRRYFIKNIIKKVIKR